VTSARRLYRLQLGIASVGVVSVVVGLIIAMTRVDPGLPSVDELLAACRRVVPSELGVGQLVVTSLVVTGLVVLALAARSLARQLRRQRRFLACLSQMAEVEVGGRNVVVVAGRGPEAFCAGFLRPRIYVSQAAMQRLSEVELAAVVAHEAHHQRSRDPLRILVSTILVDALFFLPGLRRVSRRYRQLAELAADEAATEAEGTAALASALLIFGERGGVAAPAVGIAPERVDHLAGESPGWQLPLSVFSGSLITLGALLGLIFTAPAVVGSGSLSAAALLSELCMVGMVAVPLATLSAVALQSRGRLRLRSLVHR